MDEEKDTTRRFRNERLPENRRRSAEENMSPTVEPCVEIGGKFPKYYTSTFFSYSQFSVA